MNAEQLANETLTEIRRERADGFTAESWGLMAVAKAIIALTLAITERTERGY